MSAIRSANRHRPNPHRAFQAGEYAKLVAELRGFPAAEARHWRLLARLAIEAAATPRELALATWDQFDQDFRLWRIPAVRQGRRICEKPVVMTRAGSRILKALRLISDAASPRVFHCLPESPLAVSARFGAAARRAGLADFCLRDLAGIGIAKRLRDSNGADIAQVAWALGFRHRQPPRFFRPYLR
jgi:integrase